MTCKISPSLLRKLLDYDAQTGKLYWKKRALDLFQDGKVNNALSVCNCWNARYAGKQAFTCKSNGYLGGKIFGRMHSAHRVIWAIHCGEWPKEHVDHINGNKEDNRIVNLRLATNAQNTWNSGLNKRNKSGHKGVSWEKRCKRWRSHITINGEKIHLGYHKEFQDAVNSYREAAINLHGEYVNFQNCKRQKSQPSSLCVLPRAKPTQQTATGPIKTVRNEKDVDW